MSTSRILFTLATGLIATTISAQSIFVDNNNPKTGGCNVIPFGHSTASTTWSNQRYQQMIHAADIGNLVLADICDLAFAPCGGSQSFIRHFDTIEIVMGQTSAATLSLTFSSNLVSNVQTVLSAKNYDWEQTEGVWNRIGLQKNYLYLAAQGANIVIQVTVSGARHLTTGTAGCRTGAKPRIYAFGYTGSPPPTATGGSPNAQKVELLLQVNDLHEFGLGCNGSNGTPALKLTGSAKLGQVFNIDLSGGPSVVPFLLAISPLTFDGGLDLGIIGATGCRQYVQDTILIGGATSNTGTGTLAVTTPTTSSLVCFRVYAQYFLFDRAANAAGLTSSNYGRILPGNF